VLCVYWLVGAAAVATAIDRSNAEVTLSLQLVYLECFDSNSYHSPNGLYIDT
jgi:hypothetical protein